MATIEEKDTEKTPRRVLSAEEGARLMKRLAEPPRDPSPRMKQAIANYKRIMSTPKTR